MASFKFSSASTRTLTSLNTLLASKEYYSAHQKLRTTAARLLKSSGSEFDTKAREAVELLFEGSKRLLENGERGSGSDLAEYMVEVWSSKGVQCGKEERSKLYRLIALLGSKDSWRTSFITVVMLWTSKTGPSPAGDLEVHAYIGEIYAKESNYVSALNHLILSPSSSCALTTAELLFAWSKLDPDGEVQSAGRYASKAVLTYLSLRLLGPATAFISHYLSLLLSAHPHLLLQTISIESTTSEILLTPNSTLNNLQLAILNIRVGVGEAAQSGGKSGVGRAAWLSLRGKWEREPASSPQESHELKKALAVISEVWFGIRRPNNNMLGDIMSSLFGGGPSTPARVEAAGLD